MSCQSLAAARAFENDKNMHCTTFPRSVRFSSESRSSTRNSNHETEKRETPGSISLLTLSVSPQSHQLMSQSAPPPCTYLDDDSPPSTSCRFPKLEECAHFHYERVSLGGLSVQYVPCSSGEEEHCATHNGDSHSSEGWVCLKVSSHVTATDTSLRTTTGGNTSALASGSWTEASDVREWSLTRNAHNFLQLDDMLHRCIYDRKVSGLPDLSAQITESLISDREAYLCLISDYVHHLSIIADDSINCGPVLNWLQMDNKGHKLLVANEDSSSINTPAVAAAYSVRKYVSQARDEISFEVGDMISIIDMPGPQESVWWRGKRGFRVGFFPHHCVAVIGDKVPRHMTHPPPIVGTVSVAHPIKPVLRKHGKLISLFRSFILSRPSRRSLKQQGILRERVFGCDLGEHLLNCGHEVPQVLVECARVIEERGAVDGIYRLSGGSGLTQRLRAEFDSGTCPDLSAPPVARDPHALASLLKMYFRELPNPLCTYQLYNLFVSAVQSGNSESERLADMRAAVVKLPPPHYRTLVYLMRHLRRVSLLGAQTGMTARNMAIVWAPNLLRAPHAHHALHGIAQQAVVTEFLICYAEELFSQEQGSTQDAPSPADVGAGAGAGAGQGGAGAGAGGEGGRRRPKSLPLSAPAKLLSLEEARRRGKCSMPAAMSPQLPPPSGAIAAAAIATQLKPSGSLKPKYIEVGSGPNNLPQYHTVLDLPVPGAKRGLKRSPSGWRTLFSRPRLRPPAAPAAAPPTKPHVEDIQMQVPRSSIQLRPVKSCESLHSENDTVPPLADRRIVPLKQHTRSSSCDSYFEPWQAELADMRLRLSPQERDNYIFSEEDDTALNQCLNGSSLCSTPLVSECSAEPSPLRLRVDVHAAAAAGEAQERKRSAMEEELASIGYIDGGDSPRCKVSDKHAHLSSAKRLCKDRDSPKNSTPDVPTTPVNVKMRERNSPRKAKNSSRYSGMHHINDNKRDNPVTVCQASRLTWHGKDGHSTLIKIDWPTENTSISNLTSSTLNSNAATPTTPIYDHLESDSDISDKHTIAVGGCEGCLNKTCLKCELRATDYSKTDFLIGQPVTPNDLVNLHDSLEASPLNSTEIGYRNLNRLSAVSTSSNSENDKRKDGVDRKSVMTSSHESSSSYSNPSKQEELYECYNFTRPNYINLQSSSSKSSPSSPLKSPLKSTISITFRSPTKSKPDYELIQNVDTPTNERDSVYEDIDLDKNLSIVEDASIPETDASLPTQQACQPDTFEQDLIILESPIAQTKFESDGDVYSQVKFFRKSIDEVNAMLLGSPEKETANHYENVAFGTHDYENINVDALRICDKDDKMVSFEAAQEGGTVENDNGNTIKSKKNLNVRELANRFESPTEVKGPFAFEKFKAEIKYPANKEDEKLELKQEKPATSYRLSKNSTNARSLDENAFSEEFGSDADDSKSLDAAETKYQPDLNLNLEENSKVELESITPTSENKISLVQRFEKPDLKNIIGFETEKRLSRERIEKYKEERRNFLREKYSSQSFRSNPENLTRIKIKREKDECETKEGDDAPKFERRNTVDLGQRMRFSLAKSVSSLDDIQSPDGARCMDFSVRSTRECDRPEKVSPSYNIRNMAAMFEQKSQNNGSG